MSNPQHDPPLAPPGPFADPLKNWANDDLLLEPQHREWVRQRHPEAFRVLDWPELREQFEQRNKVSGPAKARVRYLGLAASLLAGLGSMALAFSDPVRNSEGYESFAGAFAIGGILVTAGGVGLGIWLWLFDPSHRIWLSAREWTERLRQLYFQFLLAHMELAVAAMSDDGALATFEKVRTQALARLIERLAQSEKAGASHPRSGADDEAWIEPEWGAAKLPDLTKDPTHAAMLEKLFERLEIQRIDMQAAYVAAAVRTGPFSPETRDLVITATLNASSLAVPLVAIWTGLSVLVGRSAVWPLAVSAAIGAVALAARMLDQGLSVRPDARRYARYRSGILACRQHYMIGDASARFAALRMLEIHTYRDLEGFLSAHEHEKFAA